MTTATSLILDSNVIAELRHIERSAGHSGLFSGCVRRLEASVEGFRSAFADCIARSDAKGASRVAHTLKGASRQLGAQALGDLFADIERCATAGDYLEAQRTFENGAALIAESLEALKRA